MVDIKTRLISILCPYVPLREEQKLKVKNCKSKIEFLKIIMNKKVKNRNQLIPNNLEENINEITDPILKGINDYRTRLRLSKTP